MPNWTTLLRKRNRQWNRHCSCPTTCRGRRSHPTTSTGEFCKGYTSTFCRCCSQKAVYTKAKVTFVTKMNIQRLTICSLGHKSGTTTICRDCSQKAVNLLTKVKLVSKWHFNKGYTNWGYVKLHNANLLMNLLFCKACKYLENTVVFSRGEEDLVGTAKVTFCSKNYVRFLNRFGNRDQCW